MKYFASHYLWHAGLNRLFRMQRIGIDVDSGVCGFMEPLEEEVRQTEWLNGLIVLVPAQPEVRAGETFQDFCQRMSCTVKEGEALQAFYMPDFNLSLMEFPSRVRWVRL